MCGLAGFFVRAREDDAHSILQSMKQTLQHRGPDSNDSHVVSLPDDFKVGLAHTLLSIIGKQGEGVQPFQVPGGTLAFNGAIYNFVELREELRNQGCAFRTQTDTEVLAQGLAFQGVEFLKKARGMWAFAFWDSRRQVLLLGRDPFGVKPLYYSESISTGAEKPALVFASEYKALIPHLRGLDIDFEAANDYFRIRYIPGTRTLVRQVRKVPPGTVIELDARSRALHEVRYFKLVPSNKTPDEASLFEALQTAVKRRAVADVEVAALLSGGIDSSLVCDFLQKSVGELKTYTLGMADQHLDESSTARQISGLLGVQNVTIPPIMSGMDDLARLAYHLDDPYANPIILALDRIFKFISGKQRVVVTGEGSDEIFSGYVHHRAMGLLERIPAPLTSMGARFMGWIPHSVLRAALPYAGKLSTSDYEQAIYRLVCAGKVPSLSAFQSVFYLFGDGDLQYRQTVPVPAVPRNLAALREWDISNWLPDSQLFKLDKIAMASSIEAREPFVDQDLISAVMALPPQSHIALSTDKPVLRRIVRSRARIGREIVEGRKTSFFQPFRPDVMGQLPEQMTSLVQDNQAFLTHFVSPEAYHRSLQSKDSGLIAQNRVFAMGMMALWNSELWSRRGQGIAL